MGWDEDCIAAIWNLDNLVTELTSAQRVEANDEDNTANHPTLQGGGGWYGIIFPELRDLDGFFAAWQSVGSDLDQVHTSGDTTNFVDGTWTQRIATHGPNYTVRPDYRDEIDTISVSG